MSQLMASSGSTPAPDTGNAGGVAPQQGQESGAGVVGGTDPAPTENTPLFTREMQEAIASSPELAAQQKEMERAFHSKMEDISNDRKSLQRERDEIASLRENGEMFQMLASEHNDSFRQYLEWVQAGEQGNPPHLQKEAPIVDDGYENAAPESAEIKAMRDELASLKQALGKHEGYMGAIAEDRVMQKWNSVKQQYPDAEQHEKAVFDTFKKYADKGMTIEEAYALHGNKETVAQAKARQRSAESLPSPFAPQGQVANESWSRFTNPGKTPSLQSIFAEVHRSATTG